MKKLLALLMALSPLLTIAQKKKELSTIIALTYVNVIDATGTPVQSDMTVLIKENRIFGMGRTGEIQIPKKALLINAKDKYLIPGLWDMHFHALAAFGPSDYRFRLCIANGVTGIREMATKMDEMPQINRWRKQFFENTGTIPRIGAVGTLVDGSPSVHEGFDTATTSEQARLLVQKIKASGIDFVKVYAKISREVYFAIADEAKKQNISFAGHLPSVIPFRDAAEAGQRSLEHLNGFEYLFYNSWVPSPELIKAVPDAIAQNIPYAAVMKEAVVLGDENQRLDLFKYLAEKDVWLCPTLIVARRFHLFDENVFSKDPRRKYIPLAERERWIERTEQWEKITGVPLKNRTAEQNERELKFFKNALAVILPMKKAGIQFLAGTDVPIHYLYPGFSLHDELSLLVEAGLTPMEALQTATINPAKFLGMTDSLGTIEKGKIADLVLLDANPLTDIRNTQKINAVFVNGKYLPKQKLQQMLLEVEIAANKKRD